MIENQKGLPSRPNLELLRKRAKRLLAELRAGDPAARERVVARIGAKQQFGLSDVQLALARQYGFASWRALVAHVSALKTSGGAALKAVRDGDVVSLRRLLGEQPELVKLSTDLLAGELPTYPEDVRLLHVAVAAGQLESARVLIEHGAELDAVNRDGRSALHDSLEHGRRQLTELLLQAGATVDVYAAAQLGDGARLRALLAERPELVHDTSTGLPLLGWLAYAGYVELLPILLEHGVTLTAADGLRPAASCNHARFVGRLLDLGLEPNAPVDARGRTALHVAAAMPFSADASDTVRLLLERGADPRIRDTEGKTPLDLAREAAQEPKWRNFAGVIGLLEARL